MLIFKAPLTVSVPNQIKTAFVLAEITSDYSIYHKMKINPKRLLKHLDFEREIVKKGNKQGYKRAPIQIFPEDSDIRSTYPKALESHLIE